MMFDLESNWLMNIQGISTTYKVCCKCLLMCLVTAYLLTTLYIHWKSTLPEGKLRLLVLKRFSIWLTYSLPFKCSILDFSHFQVELNIIWDKILNLNIVKFSQFCEVYYDLISVIRTIYLDHKQTSTLWDSRA